MGDEKTPLILLPGFACAVGRPVRVTEPQRGLEFKNGKGEWVLLATDAKESAGVEAYMAEALSNMQLGLKVTARSYLDFKTLRSFMDLIDCGVIPPRYVPREIVDVEHYEEWSQRVVEDDAFARSATWRIICVGANPQRVRNARMGYLQTVGEGYAVVVGADTIICNPDRVTEAVHELAEAFAECKVKGFSGPQPRPGAKPASEAGDSVHGGRGPRAHQGSERDWTRDSDYDTKEHFLSMFEGRMPEVKRVMSLNYVPNARYQTEYSDIYAYGETSGFSKGSRSSFLPYLQGPAREVASVVWDKAYDQMGFKDDEMCLYYATVAMLRHLQGQIRVEGNRFYLRDRVEVGLAHRSEDYMKPRQPHQTGRGGNSAPQRGAGGGRGAYGGNAPPPRRGSYY